MELIRLNKYIADHGYASRRKAELFISEGQVKVNGKVVTDLGTKVDPERDVVSIKNEKLENKKDDKKIVLALNKPIGYVCTSRKFKGEKSVLDLIHLNDRVYPVGRLDKDSSGLILLTNDGNLALRLTHPRYEKEKEYEVEVDGPVTEPRLDILRKGITIEEGRTEPSIVKRTGAHTFTIVLTEGKNRQIRRMCAAIGYAVVKLKRIRINKLLLGSLAEGKSKVLSEDDIAKLK